MKTLKNLAVDHPYYCSDSNYYSNAPSMYFKTMGAFLKEFEDADIDYNLCFRWDVEEKDEDGGSGYSAKVFIMCQRKGIFMPITIEDFPESDVERFLAYATKHWNRLVRMWNPIS